LKLKDALFKESCESYQMVGDYYDHFDDFYNWDLKPLRGKTLSKEYLDSAFDGSFLVAGKIVTKEGVRQDCYLEIVMPERVHEFDYILVDGVVKRLSAADMRFGTAIPSVAIEKFGVYLLFYAKEYPGFGIDVLKNGLNIARQKKDIACDLGYVLRDEKRNEEAIGAFSIALKEVLEEKETEMTSVYIDLLYVELYQLYKKTGKVKEADECKRLWTIAFEKRFGRSPALNELPW
jgi:hypothetical protein